MASFPSYRVSTVLQSPYVMAKEGGGYEGFIVDVLDNIAKQAGFKYNLFPAKDGRYGGMEANGRWNGMIGELRRQEADIAAADLTITSQRERVVDFTNPFLSQSVQVLMKKPQRYYPGLGAIFTLFSSEIWLCVLFALVLVAILFMLIGRFNPYEWRQVPSDKDPRGARHSFGLRGSLMFMFSTLTLQGYRETPRSLAGRVLTVFWFIFVFLTVVAFVGSVIAFILAGVGRSEPVMPFTDIEELSKQTYIDIGVVRNGNTFSSLKNSKVDVYQRLANMIESRNTFVNSTKEGIERVRKQSGRFVMLIERLTGEYAAASAPDCSLMMYGESLFPSGLALATRKGSSLRDTINFAILKLREDGTLHMLQKKWWLNSGKCAPKEVAKRNGNRFRATAMTLRDVAAPFLLLLVGAILSVILLVGEVVFKKLRQ